MSEEFGDGLLNFTGKAFEPRPAVERALDDVLSGTYARAFEARAVLAKRIAELEEENARLRELTDANLVAMVIDALAAVESMVMEAELELGVPFGGPSAPSTPG